MNRQELYEQINRKQSFLCIGLDTDPRKIPSFLLKEEDPLFAFNKAIIDATHDVCVAYKPNVAFYECEGTKGWLSLEKTAKYIKTTYPELFLIADAKRGDIGNTSRKYAETFFERLPFDAVTVAPYMGSDSVKPFLSYPDKWVILLALTSNQGAFDFQFREDASGDPLYKQVIRTSLEWADEDQMMYVVGATQASMLQSIRQLIPEHFLLVPGVGAQGGSLDEVVQYGMNQTCGLLINSSRQVLYAGKDVDFALSARKEATYIQQQMASYLKR